MARRMLGVAALVLLIAIGALTAWGVGANGFTPIRGTFINGSYWLRQPGAAAEWIFSAPGISTVTDCTLRMNALVTQDVSGGSGHWKTVDLTLTSGTLTKTIQFTLVNLAAPPTMADSHGSGYPVRFTVYSDPNARIGPSVSVGGEKGAALLAICQNWANTKNLKVRYVWRATSESCCTGKTPSPPHHIAVNQSSIEIVPR